MSDLHYDAVLFVSFGGPERRDDVIPFLENVLRGRNVPRERMLQVAEHYDHFGGVSPINRQTRELKDAVTEELRRRGLDLPVYWGNRNWHPLLTDTLRQMRDDGIGSAIAFVTAAYSSYSSCRQYRQNIADARAATGADAPRVDKIRVFYNHPGFIAANVDRVRHAWQQLPPDRQKQAMLLFTAHSIPVSMANECRYVEQLEESCRLVAEELHLPANRWKLVYQSRSGRPEDPWLEPDILDELRNLAGQGVDAVVISPIGFLSDHLEVMYDLDVEAAALCADTGIVLSRAATVGTHPQFVSMVAQLIEERLRDGVQPLSVGRFGPGWDVCPEGCCPAPVMRRPTPSRD